MAYKVRHVGALTEAKTLSGREIKRDDYLVGMLGEQMVMLPQVPEQDHFLYQNTLPITQEQLVEKYNGILPKHLRGANVMCTCGSDAVIIINGPYINHWICRAFIQLGKHQTSFKIVDGEIQLDKKTKDERLMGDSDMNKLLKDPDDN